MSPTIAKKTSSRVGCFSMYSTLAGGSSCFSSSSVPFTMIRPSRRIAIRSARCSASSRYCVVSRTVVPCSASSLTACHTSIRAWGSSPAVGSSRKMTCGSPMRLIAISRRRRIPPEYVDTFRSPAPVNEKRSSSARAIVPGSLRCRNRATSARFSLPLRISSTAANCPVRLMDSRTSAACVTTSKPLTRAVPASALSSVDRIFTIVVLPAPFEPSRAKMLPRATSKSTPRSTSSVLYDFFTPCTWIANPRMWSSVTPSGISVTLPTGVAAFTARPLERCSRPPAGW